MSANVHRRQGANHNDEHQHWMYRCRRPQRVLWLHRDLRQKFWDNRTLSIASARILHSRHSPVLQLCYSIHPCNNERRERLRLTKHNILSSVAQNVLTSISFSTHLLELLRNICVPKQLSDLATFEATNKADGIYRCIYTSFAETALSMNPWIISNPVTVKTISLCRSETNI